MIQNTYTSEDLLRFIYKETSARESIQMASAISRNYSLKEEYKMLKETIQELPKVTFSPSTNTIKNILGHSATTALETC